MRPLTAALLVVALAAAALNLSLLHARAANRQLIASLERTLAAKDLLPRLPGGVDGRHGGRGPRPAVMVPAVYRFDPSGRRVGRSPQQRHASWQPGPRGPQRRLEMAKIEITAFADGPYVITGTTEVVEEDGSLRQHPGSSVALCRCGQSGSAPFCDGRHRQIPFRAAPRTLLVEGEA